MDLSSILQALASSDSIAAASEASGADADSTAKVLANALPLLMDGLHAQAHDDEKNASVSKALSKHSQKDASDLTAFLGNVDVEDGSKIVSHLLGDNTQEATKAIAKSSGVSTAQVIKILAVVAPLLMTLMGQQAKEENQTSGSGLASVLSTLLGVGSSSHSSSASSASGNLVGTLLSGILGTSSQKEPNILDSLLGGSGKKQEAQNPLGNILESLLGGDE